MIFGYEKKGPGATYSLTLWGNTIGTKSLTSVFEMGTGVAFLLSAPGKFNIVSFIISMGNLYKDIVVFSCLYHSYLNFG